MSIDKYIVAIYLSLDEWKKNTIFMHDYSYDHVYRF